MTQGRGHDDIGDYVVVDGEKLYTDRLRGTGGRNGAAPADGGTDDWVREPPEEIHPSEPLSYRADENPDESGVTLRLRFRTAREIVAAAPEEVPWVVRPWVAAGAITEVGGKVKNAGKTTYVAAMVRAVVTGKSFMGEPVEQGPVVYLTEQNDTTFKVALVRAGLAERDDVHVLSWKDTR